jgi:hypothetical protein
VYIRPPHQSVVCGDTTVDSPLVMRGVKCVRRPSESAEQRERRLQIETALEEIITVHCFEPLPDNLYLLFRNVFQNNLENRISIHALALSDREGKTTICNATFDNKQNRGDSFIFHSPSSQRKKGTSTNKSRTPARSPV